MKHLALISTLFLLQLLTIESLAQKTTTITMKVSATIVSGATLSTVGNIELDLRKELFTGDIFEFTTPQDLDSQVESSNSVILTNEFGEQILAFSKSHVKTKGNTHRVTLRTEIKDHQATKLRGRYSGNIVTKINYL